MLRREPPRQEVEKRHALFDPNTPHPARIYDYLLGGKDNYAADRKAAQELLKEYPEARELARQNRQFMVRAVQYCAVGGVDQFIDIGTGIPTPPNVADVVRNVHPRARIVGIDNDPLVLTHDRALVETRDGVRIIAGDIRRPQDILDNPELRRIIDFTRPVAVLLLAVLHFVTDEEDPAGIVVALRDAIAPGSFLVISSATSTGAEPRVIERIECVYQKAASPVVFRPFEEIRPWFVGLDLQPPGLVDVWAWPRHLGIGASTSVRVLGGIGRKPGRSENI